MQRVLVLDTETIGVPHGQRQDHRTALLLVQVDVAMVRGQGPDDAQVQALIDRANLLVAYNAGFDRSFVEVRFPGFADKAWACSFADIDSETLGAESAKLGALAQDQG